MLLELEGKVLEIYERLDREVATFALRTGLSCPEGCGLCCFSEKVEATVLECLPLAFTLFRTCQAELLLKRLERQGDERQCILFRPDLADSGQWGCTRYRDRALVCRLFGFAGNRDRNGKPQLAMCRVMKNGRDTFSPDLGDRSAPMVLFSDAGLRITALHPPLGTRRLPINSAIMEALYKVGMYLDLNVPRPEDKAADPDVPPDRPLFPSGFPRRRAA
jgi:Fe-S-cluster containining protein